VRIGDLDATSASRHRMRPAAAPSRFPAGSGDELVVTITGVESRLTRDRRYGELVELPAAVIELEDLADARDVPEPGAPAACRNDLLTVDGAAVDLAIDASVTARLMAGETVDVGVCPGSEAAIELTGRAASAGEPPGRGTGIDVDRVVLSSRMPTPGPSEQPTVRLRRDGTSRAATVAPCPAGCWLVLGEGYNPAWSAFVVDPGEPTALGTPTQVAGGFNGWWLPPSTGPTTVVMTWPPQRTLRTALILTALAALACIAIAIGSSVLDRRRGASASVPVTGADPVVSGLRGEPRLVAPLRRGDLRESVVAAVVLVVVAGVVIAPLWSLIALVPAALVVVLRRPLLLAIGSAALAGTLGRHRRAT
jgi:arabinofuranan 3-O-arabinosyltransferase